MVTGHPWRITPVWQPRIQHLPSLMQHHASLMQHHPLASFGTTASYEAAQCDVFHIGYVYTREGLLKTQSVIQSVMTRDLFASRYQLLGGAELALWSRLGNDRPSRKKCSLCKAALTTPPCSNTW
jgi:hypothetical protein